MLRSNMIIISYFETDKITIQENLIVLKKKCFSIKYNWLNKILIYGLYGLSRPNTVVEKIHEAKYLMCLCFIIWLSLVIPVLLETPVLLFKCILAVGYSINFFFYTCNIKLFIYMISTNFIMERSKLKTESKCVCGKCCSAVFLFFSINNYEFKTLFNPILRMLKIAANLR